MPRQRYVAHISDAFPLAATQEHEYTNQRGRLPFERSWRWPARKWCQFDDKNQIDGARSVCGAIDLLGEPPRIEFQCRRGFDVNPCWKIRGWRFDLEYIPMGNYNCTYKLLLCCAQHKLDDVFQVNSSGTNGTTRDTIPTINFLYRLASQRYNIEVHINVSLLPLSLSLCIHACIRAASDTMWYNANHINHAKTIGDQLIEYSSLDDYIFSHFADTNAYVEYNEVLSHRTYQILEREREVEGNWRRFEGKLDKQSQITTTHCFSTIPFEINDVVMTSHAFTSMKSCPIRELCATIAFLYRYRRTWSSCVWHLHFNCSLIRCTLSYVSRAIFTHDVSYTIVLDNPRKKLN